MRRGPESGFTLVEVLVALAVAAAILSLSFELFSTNATALGRTERAEAAVLLAESVLDEATVDPAVRSGEEDGFAWRIDRLPFAAPGLYRLRATVSWGGGAARRTFSLVTLRLAGDSPEGTP